MMCGYESVRYVVCEGVVCDVRVYMHTHAHTHTHVHLHTHMHTYIYIQGVSQFWQRLCTPVFKISSLMLNFSNNE